MPEDTPLPEFYVDGYNFSASVYSIQLTFNREEPLISEGAQPTREPQVVIRMSPIHAKIMAILLSRAMHQYEAQLKFEISIPPQIIQQHTIDLTKDW